MGRLSWLRRPLPEFVCPLCLGTAETPGPCGFCDSEIAAGREREGLMDYLAGHRVTQLEQRLAEARQREQAAQGRTRFYARDYRPGVTQRLRQSATAACRLHGNGSGRGNLRARPGCYLISTAGQP